MPLLTGLKYNDENTPCRFYGDDGLDKCPFIWKRLKDLGYATAYGEDSLDISSFNYHLNGFQKPPTDHYFRPFIQSLGEKFRTPENEMFCLGYKYGAEHVYDFMMDFVRMYKGSPYFGFFWTNGITHEYEERAFQLDEKITEYLSDLENGGFMDESVVIVMSDHGSRFGTARKVIASAFEVNLPIFQISLPNFLLTNEVRAALETNRERLSSHFDIYKTLIQIIGQDEVTTDCPKCQSILKPIPEDRKCEDAGVSRSFCSCREGQSIPIDSLQTKTIAKNVVNFMNHFKNTYDGGYFSKKCKDISLGQILYSRIYINDDFSKSFFVNFKSEPNQAWFEATVFFPQNSTEPVFNEDTVNIARSDKIWTTGKLCTHDIKMVKICYCV